MLMDIVKKTCKICKQMESFRRKIETIKGAQQKWKSYGNKNKSYFDAFIRRLEKARKIINLNTDQ